MKKAFIVIIVIISTISGYAQDSLYQIALKEMTSANYEKAYDTFEQAGEDYKSTGAGERYTLCNLKMAECLLRVNRLEPASSLISNIQDYTTEYLSDNQYLQAEALRIIGELMLNKGRSDEALKNLLQAEKEYPENAQIEKAETYNLLGVIYGNMLNISLSLQYHQAALDIRKQQLGDQHIKVADSYNNIGLLFLEEQPTQANIYLNRALQIYENQLGTLNPKVGFVLLNLARTQSNQMRYKEAEKTIEKVSLLWEERYGADDHPNKAFTTATAGQIKYGQGKYEQALIIQQDALQQYLRINGTKHPDVANQYQLIGKIHRSLQNYTEAIHAFQNAIYANLVDQNFSDDYDLPRINRYFHADYLLSALMDKATTLEELHINKTLRQRDLISAIDTYIKADSLISEIRQYRVNEADKLLLGKSAAQLYESGCRISLILGEQPFMSKRYYPLIFDFIERSKAAVLQQSIQDVKAKSFAGIPNDLLTVEDSLQQEISFYQQKLALGEDVNENKKHLFSTQVIFRDFIKRLENDYPDYHNLKYKTEKTDVKNIQNSLDDQTGLLQYYIGEDLGFVLLLTREDISVKLIEDPNRLEKSIVAYKNLIRYKMVDKGNQYGSELYEMLLPTFNSNISKLVIIPDGILNTLPFEALYSLTDDAYLIEQYELSYTFAAGLINESNSEVNQDKKQALLIAPIYFEYADESLPTLPGTLDETKSLDLLFRSFGNGTKLVIEEKAKEDFLKNHKLEDYDYIHLATHGRVNQSKPELSRLYLGSSSEEDGRFYSGDLYALNLKAKLVTLSACETGLGQIAKGEGIVGLSRGFIYAGAENLVVSLWQVSDEATNLLMNEFFNWHLRYENRPLASALRQSKLKMLSEERYKAPYYWASFVLIGN